MLTVTVLSYKRRVYRLLRDTRTLRGTHVEESSLFTNITHKTKLKKGSFSSLETWVHLGSNARNVVLTKLNVDISVNESSVQEKYELTILRHLFFVKQRTTWFVIFLISVSCIWIMKQKTSTWEVIAPLLNRQNFSRYSAFVCIHRPMVTI
jgi:hypothetical protein